MSIPTFNDSPSRKPTNEEETVKHPATAPFVQFKSDDAKRLMFELETVTLADNEAYTVVRDESPDYWIIAIPNRDDDTRVDARVGNVTVYVYPGESAHIPAYGERIDIRNMSGTDDVTVQILAMKNVIVRYNPPKLAGASGGGDAVSITGSVPLEVINDVGTTLDVDIVSSVPLDVSGSLVDVAGTVAISGTPNVAVTNTPTVNVGTAPVVEVVNDVGTRLDVNPRKPSTATEANVSVATSATQIKAANASRHALIIRNIGANNIYYGQASGITTSTGMLLKPDESAVIEHQSTVYGIAITGATDVRYSEETY